MFCKVCNTRLGKNDRHCPNCGQDAPAESAFAKSKEPSALPSADLSTARDVVDDDVLELDEVSGEQPRPAKKKSEAKKPPANASKPAKPAKSPAPKSTKKPDPEPEREPAAARSGSTTPLFAPDPAGLRALLAEAPEALEEGLGILRNDDGSPIGAAYTSGVGDIDLIATDAKGGLVVVMVSERNQGEELIAEVLQRVGWVRKHIGEGKKKVRGMVLCESAPEGLSYAASAVADTISFKTYRVALTFDDLEL